MEIILPEIVATGIYNSRIAAKNKLITKNRRTPMFEIEIPIEKGGVSYIDSEEMPINTNMIICAKPGQLRHTRMPFKCLYIHFIIREGVLYDILSEIPAFTVTENSHEYRDIFERMCKYGETAQENDKIMLNSIVIQLVYKLSEETKNRLYQYRMKSNNYRDVEKAIKYIKENLTSTLKLETIAAYVGFSPIHFHNCFKSATGKTLHEYVEELRITKATNLLLTTNQTLTEIAYQCGFSSQSYFSYAFKRRMKMTPREYTKEVYKRYDA